MSIIESAMPCLSEMHWQFVDRDICKFSLRPHADWLWMSDSAHPRDQWPLNMDIHHALRALDLSHLQSLTLKIPKNFITDNLDLCTRRRPAYSSVQELVLINSAIHKLSTKLRHLKIIGYLFLTPHLFWPAPAASSSAQREEAPGHIFEGNTGSTNASMGAEEGIASLERQEKEPFWPHLETFVIYLSGDQQFFSWSFGIYYEPLDPGSDLDEDEDDDEDVREAHYQRHWAEFTELIASMSRAMLRMPKLKRLSAGTSQNQMYGNQGYAFHYDRAKLARARSGDVEFDLYPPLHNFNVQNLWDWEETEEIMDNWRNLVKQVQTADEHPGISP